MHLLILSLSSTRKDLSSQRVGTWVAAGETDHLGIAAAEALRDLARDEMGAFHQIDDEGDIPDALAAVALARVAFHRSDYGMSTSMSTGMSTATSTRLSIDMLTGAIEPPILARIYPCDRSTSEGNTMPTTPDPNHGPLHGVTVVDFCA